MTRRVVRWFDRNFGGARVLRDAMRHIFPDHWSFFFGEIALYSFIILVVTGTYLAIFFRPSLADVVYNGSYAPLRGQHMSDAYRSVLQISFDVRGGLLVRQVHHWAALLFSAALVLHFGRMLFTGAYRRPRWINWVIGLTLLITVFLNGVIGYSVPDDLLSGTGLRIAYSITESIPLLGPAMASLMFGGTFPSPGLIPRIYPLHIFLVPALIAGLLSLHLAILWRQKHTEFPGRGRDERTIVGTPLMPAYALRTLGFFLLVGGVLAVLGAFAQINPVWLYGPYRAWNATTAAQPDWYTGWLEGAVRMFPSADLRIGGFLLPGLFWPAAVLPGVLAGLLYTWPWIDALFRRDRDFHNVLERPRMRAGRTAFGAGLFTFLTLLLFAGAHDVFAVILGTSVQTLVPILRAQIIVLPLIVAALTYVVARRLQASEQR